MESDYILIQSIKSGDNKAFERFYYKCRDWIVSLAYHFSQDREDSLDVLQETFQYFLKKIPGLELKANIKTFLYPVVKHLALNKKQAKQRNRPTENIPEKLVLEKDYKFSEDLLNCLPPEQREVIWLRYVDGLSMKEIADAMKLPIGTIKSRIHNALKVLKQNFKDA